MILLLKYTINIERITWMSPACSSDTFRWRCFLYDVPGCLRASIGYFSSDIRAWSVSTQTSSIKTPGSRAYIVSIWYICTCMNSGKTAWCMLLKKVLGVTRQCAIPRPPGVKVISHSPNQQMDMNKEVSTRYFFNRRRQQSFPSPTSTVCIRSIYSTPVSVAWKRRERSNTILCLLSMYFIQFFEFNMRSWVDGSFFVAENHEKCAVFSNTYLAYQS